ncbi:hypothetical protein [Breoghania sp.]|uniref:hypothetical protein n=1 Tax=Breoghania sp. TaxID=2065378 RepID=UPI00262B9D2D|nr:hypothetical protein [Breoghania sp.]MDJ0932034.1 hypothetical protein [Breoghania sp.]
MANALGVFALEKGLAQPELSADDASAQSGEAVVRPIVALYGIRSPRPRSSATAACGTWWRRANTLSNSITS